MCRNKVMFIVTLYCVCNNARSSENYEISFITIFTVRNVLENDVFMSLAMPDERVNLNAIGTTIVLYYITSNLITMDYDLYYIIIFTFYILSSSDLHSIRIRDYLRIYVHACTRNCVQIQNITLR